MLLVLVKLCRRHEGAACLGPPVRCILLGLRRVFVLVFVDGVCSSLLSVWLSHQGVVFAVFVAPVAREWSHLVLFVGHLPGVDVAQACPWRLVPTFRRVRARCVYTLGGICVRTPAVGPGFLGCNPPTAGVGPAGLFARRVVYVAPRGVCNLWAGGSLTIISPGVFPTLFLCLRRGGCSLTVPGGGGPPRF